MFSWNPHASAKELANTRSMSPWLYLEPSQRPCSPVLGTREVGPVPLARTAQLAQWSTSGKTCRLPSWPSVQPARLQKGQLCWLGLRRLSGSVWPFWMLSIPCLGGPSDTNAAAGQVGHSRRVGLMHGPSEGHQAMHLARSCQ